jgi:hypothetical protein
MNRQELVTIKDNFLPEKEFDEIQKKMIDPATFAWFYNDIIDDDNDVDKFQFIHVFYINQVPVSPHIRLINFVCEVLHPVSVWKVKANLLTRTPKIIENTFHVDMEFLPEEQQKHWTTSIFYVNTNNGYTKFEDGTKIESVENRLVSFPSNMKHTGTSCTDEKTRVVINFNYYN